MNSYEIVLRREGEPDEVVSLEFEQLIVGQPFEREGLRWVVARDDGPSKLPDHAARLICEPADTALGAI